jgi:hypothetical protein
MDKQQIQERQQLIIDLIGEFCTQKLNKEYFELSKRLMQKLGRKRNVPFETGKPEVWAAGVIHALGTINFLFDKSFEPYVTIDEINNFFDTSKSTTGAKSKQIRDLLKLDIWDKEFSTSRIQDGNPFAKMVMVDGFLVPLNTLPEAYQEMVRQARAEGKDLSFTSD